MTTDRKAVRKRRAAVTKRSLLKYFVEVQERMKRGSRQLGATTKKQRGGVSRTAKRKKRSRTSK